MSKEHGILLQLALDVDQALEFEQVLRKGAEATGCDAAIELADTIQKARENIMDDEIEAALDSFLDPNGFEIPGSRTIN